MMYQFFWSRAASIWIAALYVLLGLALLLFPTLSGSVLVWSLAAGAGVYAVSHLFRYLKGRKQQQSSGGDLFLSVLPLAFSVFALLWPEAVLSFLPLVLGSLLLIDGVGKLPLAVAALREKSSVRLPMTLSSLLPMAVGAVILVNPFQTAQVAIAVFGLALIADGISDFWTAITTKKTSPLPDAPVSEAPVQEETL